MIIKADNIDGPNYQGLCIQVIPHARLDSCGTEYFMQVWNPLTRRVEEVYLWCDRGECNVVYDVDVTPEFLKEAVKQRAAELDAEHRAEEVKRVTLMVLKGRTVKVVRGRKVPLGTTGVVFWLGRDSYGNDRIGFKDSDGYVFWTAEKNVEVIP